MIDGTVMEHLRNLIPEDKIFCQEPMAGHTTFRIGGPADCMLEIEGEEQLKAVLKYLNQGEAYRREVIQGEANSGEACRREVIQEEENSGEAYRREVIQNIIPYFVLGNGSNLLVGDEGFRGVVLHLGAGMNRITVSGNRITAQAGALLSQTARAALDHGLTGLEFAAGIPGSIGGAVVMNAGAYGGEMKQVVETVTVVTPEGEELVLDRETMDFGYRTSLLKKQPLIATKVVLKLEPGDPVRVKAKMEELAARRREKQPLEFPSAGSTFKRPEGHFAGQLIEQAGLRGFQVGGARVSDKHCGFVINTGGATARDVLQLIEIIKQKVKENSGVDLEEEVIVL